MGFYSPIGETFDTLPGEDKLNSISQMLFQRPDYEIEQINGQRYYRLKDTSKVLEPKRGLEVYVCRLPRDAYEDELIPVFETVGRIKQMRLMMDLSGNNRGYAYVEYFNSTSAKKAIEELNGYELRTDESIVVTDSKDKSRLFIGGIPKNRKKKELLKEMKRVTEGVKDVILYMSVFSNKNRGFCFVEYNSHWEAAMARRRMGLGFKLWNSFEVRVNWAYPEPEVDEEIMKEVKVLHVRNLNINVDEDELKEVFSFDGFHIERVKKIRDFAFIHYESRDETEIALNITNGNDFKKKYPHLKGIVISLARPPRHRNIRKRAISTLSTDSSMMASTPNSSQIFYNSNVFQTPNSQVGQEFKYYQSLSQTLCENESPIQYQIQQSFNPLVPINQQLVPIKYDSVVEEKNSFQFFVVCVPVVWLPSPQNRD